MKAKNKLVAVVVMAIVAFGFVLFVPLGDRELKAIGTTSGIILTNVAVIKWMSGASNFNTNVSNISVAVGTNYGMTWIGHSTNMVIDPGSSHIMSTYLTNEGNSDAEIFVLFSSNLNAASQTWNAVFSNVTAGGAAASSLVLLMSPAAGSHIRFIVTTPGNETNGAFTTYQCLASNSNAVAEIGNMATNYTGYNAVSYGGNMGLFPAGPGTTFLTNPQPDFTNWTLTIGVANILLQKTAQISNSGPFAANTTVPYPGAWITFALTYTNKGLATATNVTIVDTFPTNYLTYKPGTLKKGTYNNTWYNAGTPLSDGINDDEGAYTNDNLILFNPGGSAPGTAGVIGPTSNAGFFYQTTLN